MRIYILRNIKKFYLPYFIIGALFFGVISLFMKEVNFISKVVFVLIVSSIMSFVFGSIFLFSNKLIRPRISQYFLNHKNIKSLKNHGLEFNKEDKRYSGMYRDFYIQVVYSYDDSKLFNSEYVINVLFKEVSIEKIKKLKIRKRFKDTYMIEVAIRRFFTFRFFPPKYMTILTAIDEMINYLIEIKLEPIHLDDIEKLFEGNVA